MRLFEKFRMKTKRVRLIAGAALAVSIAGVPAAWAVCVGDCNSDGSVTVDEILKAVNIGLGIAPLSQCVAANANNDGAVTVDEVVGTLNSALNGCHGVPSETGQVRIHVYNPLTTSAAIYLHGNHIEASMTGVGPGSKYDINYTMAPGENKDFNVGSTLALGIWRHQITVASTGQKQGQTTLVIDDPTTGEEVQWTVFGKAITVDTTVDSGTACPSAANTATCSLRKAIETANSSATGPVLIQFKDGAFANPITVTVAGELAITKAGTTIDGTNFVDGHPYPFEAFGERQFPVRIEQSGTSQLAVRTSGVNLIGLHLGRAAGSGGDVVRFLAPASGKTNGTIRTCRLDGGAGAATSAVAGNDCVEANDINSTGAADQAIIRNSELRYCAGTGVLVRKAHVLARDSWIHHNLYDGLVPLAGSGNLSTSRNLIERNGLNAGNATVRAAASQASTDDGTSTVYPELHMNGDVVRDGPSLAGGPYFGVYFRDFASGSLTDVFACGFDGDGGIGAAQQAGYSAPGNPSRTITVRGTTVAKNERYGMYLHQDGVGPKANIDFGTGTSGTAKGRNSFSGNNTSGTSGVHQLRNGTGQTAITLEGNQWASCGNGSSCDLGDIRDIDTNQENMHLMEVDVDNSEAHRGGTISISSIYPLKVENSSEIVHITGTGFNAVEGFAAATGCGDLHLGNRGPDSMGFVSGTFVEFSDPIFPGNWHPASEYLAVTPTHIAVRPPMILGMPFRCTKESKIRVKKRNTAELTDPIVSPAADFCVNPDTFD